VTISMKTKEKMVLGTLVVAIMIINLVNFLEGQRLKRNALVIIEEVSEKISVNQVGVEELEALPGIGPHLANRIIQYRNEHGAFEHLEDLKKVRGIGDKLLKRIMPYITIQ